MFTKDDLRDGMTVVDRDGNGRIVLHGSLLWKNSKDMYVSAFRLTQFNSDLSHKCDKEIDIMTVKDSSGAILFQRAPEKVKVTLELTPEQADSIKKQFGIEL